MLTMKYNTRAGNYAKRFAYKESAQVSSGHVSCSCIIQLLKLTEP